MSKFEFTATGPINLSQRSKRYIAALAASHRLDIAWYTRLGPARAVGVFPPRVGRVTRVMSVDR